MLKASMMAVMETATEETMEPLAATPTPAGPSVGHEPGRRKVQGPIGQEVTQKGVRPLLVAARAGVIGRGAILRVQSCEPRWKRYTEVLRLSLPKVRS